jgi:hypothetical protein
MGCHVSISPIEGIVQNGQIHLLGDVVLPENTKVYVVMPSAESIPTARVYSPRLAHPEQASDFVKQVVEVSSDAGIQ